MNYWKVKANGTANIPERNKEAWLRPLTDGSFFAEQPQYRNDVLLSNRGSVSASRFYVIGRRADPEASAEEELMLGVRELAARSFVADHNDVLLSNRGSVSASRFYVTGRRAEAEAGAEEGLTLGSRELAAGSEPVMIPYSPEFIYYERYLSVKKDTLLPIGVTIIGSC